MNVKTLATFLIVLFIASACEQQSYQADVSSQNNADTQATWDQLAPAEGTYKGTMHLAASNQDFECELQVQRLIKTENTPATTADPTQTVQVPQLGGSLHFKVIDRLYQDKDSSLFSDFNSLLEPMGLQYSVLFDHGDYQSQTQIMTLPYSVIGYDKIYGELTGTLSNGEYKGTWTSKNDGTVGTFDLTQGGPNP